MLLTLVLAMTLTLQPDMQTEEYWRGWCAGHAEGRQLASHHIHALLDGVRAEAQQTENTTVVTLVDTLRAIDPMVTFGLSSSFTITLTSGLQVSCPSGTILTPARDAWKG